MRIVTRRCSEDGSVRWLSCAPQSTTDATTVQVRRVCVVHPTIFRDSDNGLPGSNPQSSGSCSCKPVGSRGGAHDEQRRCPAVTRRQNRKQQTGSFGARRHQRPHFTSDQCLRSTQKHKEHTLTQRICEQEQCVGGLRSSGAYGEKLSVDARTS